MSSGGSSGFPSTPAPTPFTYHPGGVRPEDLAAGISRLSVIEEGDVQSTSHQHQQQQQQQQVSIRVVMDDSGIQTEDLIFIELIDVMLGSNRSTWLTPYLACYCAHGR